MIWNSVSLIKHYSKQPPDIVIVQGLNLQCSKIGKDMKKLLYLNTPFWTNDSWEISFQCMFQSVIRYSFVQWHCHFLAPNISLWWDMDEHILVDLGLKWKYLHLRKEVEMANGYCSGIEKNGLREIWAWPLNFWWPLWMLSLFAWLFVLNKQECNYSDIIMSAMASQITSFTIVYSRL